MSLMKALGIKDDKSMKNLGEIVGKMSATDLGYADFFPIPISVFSTAKVSYENLGM